MSKKRCGGVVTARGGVLPVRRIWCSDVPLTLDMTSTRPTLSTEAYPKPGDPNPLAELEYFDLETGERWLLPTQPDTTDGDPWYIFGVTSPRTRTPVSPHRSEATNLGTCLG